MLKAFATAISYLFHPLLLPTYAFLLILLGNPYMFANLDQNVKARILATILLNTFFLPVIAVVLMRRLNFVSSLHLGTQQERYIPLIATGVFYFWSFLVFKKLPIDPFMVNMLLGASIAIAITFVINIFYKLSIHTVGAGYLLGIAVQLTAIATYDFSMILITIIIIAGLVGSARLYLTAHDQGEIYMGYFIGFVGMILAYHVF